MYYNVTTKELTSSPPWGNHYYDPDVLAELYSEWSEVAEGYVPTIVLTKAQKYAVVNAKYSAVEQGLLNAIQISDALGLSVVALKAKVLANKASWKAELLTVK